MPIASEGVRDARARAGEEGSATVEFLGLSIALLVPLVYLMVFVSQLQAAAFGVVAAADQAARVMVAGDGGDAAQAERAMHLTLSDYGIDVGEADADVDCQVGGCATLEPGEVVEVTVQVGVRPPLLPASWLPDGVVTVDSHARSRMPRY